MRLDIYESRGTCDIYFGTEEVYKRKLYWPLYLALLLVAIVLILNLLKCCSCGFINYLKPRYARPFCLTKTKDGKTVHSRALHYICDKNMTTPLVHK